MAKTRQEKENILNRYKQLLDTHPDYIIVDIDRTTMSQLVELKEELLKSGSEFQVLKNTLFKIAAQDKNQPNRVQEIAGSSAIIAIGDDPTSPSKALSEIQKKYENLPVKFGFLFGETTDADKIKQLALIPSREELLAKLVGSMQSPLTGFMSVVSGNTRKFICALSEIQKGKAN